MTSTEFKKKRWCSICLCAHTEWWVDEIVCIPHCGRCGMVILDDRYEELYDPELCNLNDIDLQKAEREFLVDSLDGFYGDCHTQADMDAKYDCYKRLVDGFRCPVCFEVFDQPVWHCPNCAHHYLDHEFTCRNCYLDRPENI